MQKCPLYYFNQIRTSSTNNGAKSACDQFSHHETLALPLDAGDPSSVSGHVEVEREAAVLVRVALGAAAAVHLLGHARASGTALEVHTLATAHIELWKSSKKYLCLVQVLYTLGLVYTT